MLVRRQREANLKARWNALRPRHGDEQRMEIGAVALLSVAGVEHVAAAPASAGFVVAQRSEDVVINCTRFVERLLFTLSNLHGEIGGQSRDGHECVRL